MNSRREFFRSAFRAVAASVAMAYTPGVLRRPVVEAPARPAPQAMVTVWGINERGQEVTEEFVCDMVTPEGGGALDMVPAAGVVRDKMNFSGVTGWDIAWKDR